ncbi:MAG: hypothetical protein ABW352_19865 [Polyangiales bacterium]
MLLLVACGVGGVDKPTAPSTAAVLASFVAPTGSLAGQTAAQQAQQLAAPLAGVLLLCGLDACSDGCRSCRMTDTVSRTLSKVADALDTQRPDAGKALPEIPGAAGLVDVHTICEGWSEASADPAHGSYSFSVGFTGRGVDPIGSGRFDACQLKLGDKALRATGSLLYTFEPAARVPFAEVASAPITLAFEGSVQSEAGVSYGVNMAVRSSGEISFTLPALGSFVATFAGDTVDVRGRDQTLRCKLREMVCDALPP